MDGATHLERIAALICVSNAKASVTLAVHSWLAEQAKSNPDPRERGAAAFVFKNSRITPPFRKG